MQNSILTTPKEVGDLSARMRYPHSEVDFMSQEDMWLDQSESVEECDTRPATCSGWRSDEKRRGHRRLFFGIKKLVADVK